MKEGTVFDIWNQKKKETNYEGSYPTYFQAGQIWWTQLGQNIATEVVGKGDNFLRPTLILRVVYGNASIVIPLTTIERSGNYYFNFLDSKANRQCALLTQIRYIDGKRLKYPLSNIKKEDLNNLLESLYKLLKK